MVTETLKELNESVAGSYVEEDPRSLIASNPAFFAQFDLVLASQAGGAACVLGCVWRRVGGGVEGRQCRKGR